jgi:hypothetical protein
VRIICQRCQIFVFLFQEFSPEIIIDNFGMMQNTAPHEDYRQQRLRELDAKIRCKAGKALEHQKRETSSKEKPGAVTPGAIRKLGYALIAFVSSLCWKRTLTSFEQPGSCIVTP